MFGCSDDQAKPTDFYSVGPGFESWCRHQNKGSQKCGPFLCVKRNNARNNEASFSKACFMPTPTAKKATARPYHMPGAKQRDQ